LYILDTAINLDLNYKLSVCLIYHTEWAGPIFVSVKNVRTNAADVRGA